jgi:hypothetical protein
MSTGGDWQLLSLYLPVLWATFATLCVRTQLGNGNDETHTAKNIIAYKVTTEVRDQCMNGNIIVACNSILYYLCAESTAARPVTDTHNGDTSNSKVASSSD